MLERLLKLSCVVVVCGLVTSACSDKKRPNVELIQDMMRQEAIQPQGQDIMAPDKPGMRLPPAGTVPVGGEAYPFKLGQDVEAGKVLVNPQAGVMTPELLQAGKAKYDIFCAICHGNTGLGDGAVAPTMALKPPPLVSSRVVGFPDGQIFHIMTRGRGLMGSYVNQLSAADRWAVVNYIRSLQKTGQSNN